jgi:hypothetical protein
MPDHTLRMMIRTRNGLYYSDSADGGNAWSTAAPLTDANTGSKISGVEVRTSILLLQSGAQMIVYNDSQNAGRDGRLRLSVALSYDDGRTWPYRMLLDERLETSYPSVTQAQDGTIYIAYDLNRYNEMFIYIAALTEDAIKAGGISEGGGFIAVANSNGMPEDGYYSRKGSSAVLGTLASLEALGEESGMRPLAPGAKAYLDRHYTIRSVPYCFGNARFVQTNRDAGYLGKPPALARVVTAGWVYVFTPLEGTKGALGSLQEALRLQGFETVDAVLPQRALITSSPDLSMVLMRRYCQAGETLSTGGGPSLMIASDATASASSVTLLHIDAEDPSVRLSGAVFALYADNGDGVFGEGDGYYAGFSGYAGNYTYGGLRPGVYFLVQRQAAEGYRPDDNVHRFEIRYTGQSVAVENSFGVGFVNRRIPAALLITGKAGQTCTVESAGYSESVEFDGAGRAFLQDLKPGGYKITTEDAETAVVLKGGDRLNVVDMAGLPASPGGGADNAGWKTALWIVLPITAAALAAATLFFLKKNKTNKRQKGGTKK